MECRSTSEVLEAKLNSNPLGVSLSRFSWAPSKLGTASMTKQVSRIFLNPHSQHLLLSAHSLQADMRHAVGQVWGTCIIADLGRPETPRKAPKINGATQVAAPNLYTPGQGSVAVDNFFSAGDQVSHKINAPMADSALSSTGSASFGPAIRLDLDTTNEGGQKTAQVRLTDVRKQLMTMGLFPPGLYGIGESFEEMRQRYVSFAYLKGQRWVIDVSWQHSKVHLSQYLLLKLW